MGRFITHDEESTVYWESRTLAVKHIRLMAKHGVVLDLYRELELGRFGPGKIVESGFSLI
jgi:hypothetical protein